MDYYKMSSNVFLITLIVLASITLYYVTQIKKKDLLLRNDFLGPYVKLTFSTSLTKSFSFALLPNQCLLNIRLTFLTDVTFPTDNTITVNVGKTLGGSELLEDYELDINSGTTIQEGDYDNISSGWLLDNICANNVEENVFVTITLTELPTEPFPILLNYIYSTGGSGFF